MSPTQLPEDPEYTSEPKVLSPVSPKPLHVPIPDNIPVLHNQIDPVFNQMDTHIGDTPAVVPDAAQAQPPIDGTAPADLAPAPVGSSSTAQQAQQGPPGGFDSAMASVQTTDVSTGAPSSLNTDSSSVVQSPALGHPSHTSSATTAIPQGADPAAILPPKPAEADETAYSAANVPDYTALLNSITLPKNLASTLDTTASYIPLDDTPAALPHAPPATGLPPRPSQSQDHASNGQFQSLPSIPGQPAPGVAYPQNTNGLPPPPMASFQQSQNVAQPSQMSPTQTSFAGRAQSSRDGRQGVAAGENGTDDEAPWTVDIKNAYESFLEQEREYVTEGNWEQFPYGSRLFVGNLSSERVTKRDVFHAFHKYGQLAQISIKQAYGFVQFLNAADCGRAMDGEQGRIIRGKRINLEISKPQKNRSGGGGGRRRSRSPDRPSGTDRYAPSGGRQSDTGRRGRDDYRPGRSPSPRGYRNRSRDRHGRYRSRSRSPRGRGGRHRSPSPRRDDGDDLPLPRRAGREVPDVQIIVADELDRNFVQWVESGIASRGVKVDVLLLSPRLSEAAVIKRQIVEGVVAVSRLTRANQQTGKIPLQVFDRRGGNDVRFEEYADLDPNVAAEVVLRARANNQPSYGYGYGGGSSGPAQQPSYAQAALPPNLSSAISTMDASSLQKLLGSIQQPGGQQPGQPTGLTPDIAKLLAGSAVPGAQYGQQHSPAQDPLAALRNNPALAGLLGAQGGQQQQQSSPAAAAQQGQGAQPNMADILSKLGSYRR